MILSSKIIESHLVLKIEKDVMMDNAKDFFKEFELIFQNIDPPKFVSFDFSKVNFMDSSGIGSLIKSASIIKKNSSAVNVFNLNKSLLSVFRLSGLDTILSIYSEEEFQTNFPEFNI